MGLMAFDCEVEVRAGGAETRGVKGADGAWL